MAGWPIIKFYLIYLLYFYIPTNPYSYNKSHYRHTDERRQYGLDLGPQMRFRFLKVKRALFSWKSTEWPMLFLGVALSFITTLITTAYGPIFGKYIKSKTQNRVVLGFNFLI